MTKRFDRFTAVAFTLALLFCLAASVSAGPKQFGVKAGITLADQDYEYLALDWEDERDYKVGLTIGMFVDVPLTSFLSLRPGMEYVQKGSDLSQVIQWTNESSPEIVGDSTIEFSDRIDYLSIPILAELTLPTNTYLVLGPRLDVKIGSSSETASIFADEFKSVVFGGTVGIGQEFMLGSLGPMLLEFDYHHDFSKALDNSNLEVKNKTLAFALGYRF